MSERAVPLVSEVKAGKELVIMTEDRQGEELEIPLEIWRTPEFQYWYSTQRAAGNTLLGARVVWTFRSGRTIHASLWYWALHVDMYVGAEQRRKSNEVVLSRPDIATIALFRPATVLSETPVILIREYRSPATTPDGYVWELPGGSGKPGEDPTELVIRECKEETGLTLSRDRLTYHGTRQLAATMLCHRAHLFSAQLSDKELTGLHNKRGIPLGVAPNERTFVEILSIREIRERELVDWTTLGMIYKVLG